ncbi:alpha-protein kinase 1 isoform X1 [Anguilla rostrata]|uniref:alpha-protein kinase 1 isoform X1 n=2 Tax=Anguilla rostrata TaxID=7938 RepID=UPI0030CD6A15
MCLGCSFTTMNNQDVVAMLEECWQAVAAGPLEPTDEAKEGFRRCKASLSAELSSLLQDAAAMRWPFVPEKWQYKQAVASEDKATLKELVGGHLPQLLTFMRASILAREPVWAASVVFLVDRFLYWADTSRSLLKIAEVLHRRYPATPIAPQLVIRQARLALNSGKLQKAEYILSSLINNSGATGCWVYHADSDRVLVQAVSVQIRGQVLQKLGMWVEAAELIWASLIGLHALPEPDRKGIGASLGLLANILVSMSDADFQAFVAGKQVDQRLLKERGHRLLAAAEAAKMAVVYSQYDSLYVLTGAVTQGTCLLAYSFLPGCGAAEREAVLTEAKEAFEIGLLTKREGEVVTSKQELHTLIKAAYSLTVTHRWLGSARGQVRQASQECQKAVEKLHAYSAAGGGERDALGTQVMGLVGRVKAVLGVEPFAKSDERSFVPDGYRSAEETPVRFSTDRFAEAMGRFRKHHASVCQARRTSCKAAASSRRGVPGCSGPCVTAMKTTTAETLDTDGATEDLRHFANENGPPGRRSDRRTDGGHVDQQCSTELSDGEEISGAAGSEEGGFKGMGKTRSTPRSHGDGAAPFADARTRSKDRGGVTRAGRKAEKKWVDQKCLTEVSDEDDRNASAEGPGPSAGREGEGASGHRERPRTSSGGSSALPSSWEAISSSPDTGSKKARATTRRPVTEWAEVGMDLQGDTKDSDEEDMKAATGSKGCRSSGVGNAMTSPRSLRNGPPSLLDSRGIRKGKGIVTHAKQRVETWVDQQCATEFSDEEVDGGTNNAGGGFKGIGNAGTASSFLGDSLGSNSSWQKLSLSDTGSPVSGGKPTRRPSASHTEEGWVNLDCPEEVKDQEELGQAGRGFEATRRAGTSISSLGDSLGSSASWQKLGFSDAGSLSSNGRGGSGPTAKQRADVWVDPQCPTLGSDEEDQGDMGSLPPVRTLKPDYPVNGLQPHPSRPPSSAPNPVPGCKNRVGSEEDQSFLLVELPGGGHGGTPRTSAPTGVPAGDVALRCGSRMWDVDPAAETEDYVLGDLSMSADSVDLEASAAGLGGPGHFAEPKTFGTVGNAEGRDERDLGKLCLDDYRQPSDNNQSHDRCVGTCMLCSEVPECSPTLTEKDYKALLSGVCHKCLLSRLDIKKTFRLRKHRTAYSALLLKYSKVSDRWTSRETKVYIGDPLGKQGCQRTAFWVQILHQEEVLGSYVGKTYRYEKEIHYHLNDVERQVTAQYYVTEFNKRLYEKSIPAQIFFIPSEVLLILEDDVIADCVTVEPYMLGDFVKLTNNTVYTNREYEATDYGVAFGHFTYQLSRGTEVVVDLQGWVTDSGKGLTYLTDPQIHSVREGGARSRRGERGIRQFLESQHGPRCNDICEALSLGAL